QLALSQRGGLSVAPAEPFHLVDWQLRQMDLGALRSQLLWEIASSGHGVMRLLDGVVAQVDGRSNQLLHLVVALRTQSSAVDLNGPSQGQIVAADALIQIEDDALASASQPSAALLSQVRNALQRNPILSCFLQRQAVQLLQPGQRWQQTFLQLEPRLVVTTADRGAALWVDDPVDDSQFVLPVLPGDLASFVLSEQADIGEIVAVSEAVARAPDQTETAPTEDFAILTADDLALALTGSPPETSRVSETDPPPVKVPSPTPALVGPSAQERVSEHRNGHTNGHRKGHLPGPRPLAQPPGEADALLPAWITITDDRWVATLSEMIARQQLIAELPLNRLLGQLGQEQAPLDNLLPQVITAACTATERASADTGLLRQNFFQQSVYLEDLLQQLLWYVYRSSPVIAQLIGGIPAQFLAPEHLWQTGELRLLTTLQLRTQQRKMMIDLATATPLAYPVQRLPREGVVQAATLPLTQQPYTVAQLETRLYRLLRQATPELDWLLRGTPLEMHLLEPTNEPECQSGAMQLGLGLQFVAPPTTVMGEVVG
ncbi:MAG: hypothetical protein AAFU71_11915, partial [Cyanobacteria bacterium J06632_22]